MNNLRLGSFRLLPPVIKNLMIINGIFFLATNTLDSLGIDMVHYFGLHLPNSPLFKPHQLVTYIFMHSDFMHIFINMFMLWMFGKTLEDIWGGKRFLIFYIATGMGGGILFMLFKYLEYHNLSSELPTESIQEVLGNGANALVDGKNYIDYNLAKLNQILNVPTIGASGAVFGILMAFGMTFPNQLVYVYFFIPIKVKYFVIIIGLFELFRGITGTGGNVANFAHLGGMIFGFILIKYWRSKRIL